MPTGASCSQGNRVSLVQAQLPKSNEWPVILPSPRSGSSSVHLSRSFFLDCAQGKAQPLLSSRNPPTPSILNVLVLEICGVEGRDADSLPRQPCSVSCSPASQQEAGLVFCAALLLASLQSPSYQLVLCPQRCQLLVHIGIFQTNTSLSPRRIVMITDVLLVFQRYYHHYFTNEVMEAQRG